MGQKEKRGVTVEVGWAIAFGMIGAIFIMMILSVAGAGLIAKEVLPQERIGIISLLICAIGMLIGCRIAIGKSGYGALPVSLGCAGLSLLILYIGRVILRAGTAYSWQNVGVGMAAAVLAALLWSGRKGKRR